MKCYTAEIDLLTGIVRQCGKESPFERVSGQAFIEVLHLGDDHVTY